MNRNKTPSFMARNWETLVDLDIATATPFEKVRSYKPMMEGNAARSKPLRARQNFHRPRAG